MALTDSDNRLKRTPDNDRRVMKSKADRVLVADVMDTDIDKINWAKKNLQENDHTVGMMRDLEKGGLDLSKGEKGITDPEIKDVISGKITEPTGIHKKKKGWLKKLLD